MIVKIKITDSENKEFTMLFGNSYKNFLAQVQEFFYNSQKWINHMPYPIYSILSIESSDAEWKGWGGLKWCLEDEFQKELNREGCQHGEPDNSKPRQYSEMIFSRNYSVDGNVMDWYNRQYQERQIVS